MIRLPRGEETGYETIPPNVRKKIMITLENYDVYGNNIRTNGLLPDHKFTEIRWDQDTKNENTIDMNEKPIRAK